MFGLSTWEILIILAVALIFVGPDQLPKVARQIGKGVRQVRGAVGKVDDEMRRAVREAAAEFDDDGNPVTPPAPPPSPAATSQQALPPMPETATPTAPVDPIAANAPPQERDWSQVGKTPVTGAVGRATAQPGRPVPPPADPATPPAPAVDLAKPTTPPDGTSTT